MQSAETNPLLSVENLAVQFDTRGRSVRAVDGVSFELFAGETLAVVGESGSGKSVTAMSILRLIESQRGRIVSGSIRFQGRNILDLTDADVRALRGNEIAMVFQEPMTSLNPVFTIGDQIGEVLQLHAGLSEEAARRETTSLLDLVEMPDPERRLREYPHQLSGGMRQRVMIAMALACRPRLLIADEPTTALDVTIQAQILQLLANLQKRLGMAILLITHDLSVVATLAHRVAVMYAGRVVESAATSDLFERPRHPYTLGLMRSLPGALSRQATLSPIPGNVPDAGALPSGCRFHPRCRFSFEPCKDLQPLLQLHRSALGPHGAACHYARLHPERELALVPTGHEHSPAEAVAAPQDVNP